MKHSFKSRPKEVIEYTPTDFLEYENPPTFFLRHLSNKEIADIADEAVKYDPVENKLTICLNKSEYIAGRLAIVGWKNIMLDDKEVEYRTSDDGHFDESIFEGIPIFDIIAEVGSYITRRDE